MFDLKCLCSSFLPQRTQGKETEGTQIFTFIYSILVFLGETHCVLCGKTLSYSVYLVLALGLYSNCSINASGVGLLVMPTAT